MSRGRQCQVCAHPKRVEVELALVRGVPVRAIAQKIGVNFHAVYRHKRKHMPATVWASLAAGEPNTLVDGDKLREEESEALLGRLISYLHRAEQLLSYAESHGDINGAARIHARLEAYLGLEAKLLGQLTAAARQIVTNILIQPQYIELRLGLMNALRDYPEARQQVANNVD